MALNQNKLLSGIFIYIFLVSCLGEKPNDGLEFDPPTIGTIYEGQTKIIILKVKRASDSLTHVWMGFKEASYKTDALSIAHLPVGNTVHTVEIEFHVPLNSGIPSGNYTLYATMGKGSYNTAGAHTLACESKCVYFESGTSTSNTVQAHLEYLSDYPINYQLEGHNLFQLQLRTKLTGLNAGDEYWVRVYLEVLMPGRATPLQSNYYTYLEFSNDFWEEMTLEFGGGDYAWDGDMQIKTRVKLYDNWPEGNETDPNVNLIYPYQNKVLAPASTPSLEQVDVEYDQQVGENLFDEIMYISGTTGTNEDIDAAYAPALKKVVFHKDLQHQAIDPEIIYRTDRERLLEFLSTYHTNSNQIYLCTVQEIVDTDNKRLFGSYEILFDDITGDILESGIFFDYGKHLEVQEPYGGALSDDFVLFILTGTVIHEIGHALGIQNEDHNIGHTPNSIYCVMYSGIVPNIDPMVANKKRSLYPNMHFCEDHINEIKY